MLGAPSLPCERNDVFVFPFAAQTHSCCARVRVRKARRRYKVPDDVAVSCSLAYKDNFIVIFTVLFSFTFCCSKFISFIRTNGMPWARCAHMCGIIMILLQSTFVRVCAVSVWLLHSCTVCWAALVRSKELFCLANHFLYDTILKIIRLCANDAAEPSCAESDDF